MNRSTDKFRILWYSPWFTSLTSNYLDSISRCNLAECLLVTTDSHPAKDGNIFPNFLSVDSTRKDSIRKRIRSLIQIQSQILQFSPDISVIDVNSSFRWMVLSIVSSLKSKRCFVVHEPRNRTDKKFSIRLSITLKFIFLLGKRFIVFSKYANAQLKRDNRRIFILPLIPEIHVKQRIEPRKRAPGRVIGMIGRWDDSKGFDFGFEILKVLNSMDEDKFEIHLWVSGLNGSPPDLGPNVTWKCWNSFQWSALLIGLEEVSVVVLPYKSASQSGVLVLANSLGIPTLSSKVGGLPEYQDPTIPCLDMDPKAWAYAIKEVHSRYSLFAESALNNYRSMNTDELIAQELRTLLEDSSYPH